MLSTTSRLTWLAALPVFFVSGCFAPVEREDDPSPSFVDRIIGPEHYWVRDDVPPLKELGAKKIAIADFTIEFVKGKYQRFEYAPLRVDPVQYYPAGAALVVLGIGRFRANYGDELPAELPTQLYEDFVRKIESEGVEVVPMASVTSSAAYEKFTTRESDSSTVLRYLNPIGSDTGRIRSFIELPVEGLQIVDGAKDELEIEQVEAELLNELGVDLVVRARFRVGVHGGRACVERGSEITVLGKDILGSLLSTRSLTSTATVSDEAVFLPVVGYEYKVDPDQYRKAMRTLFPTYLELGIEEVKE